MALSKLEGRITVTDTSSFTISVTDAGGTASISIPVGDYYLTASTSLLSTLAAAMTANATLTGVYAASLDDDNTTSTGKVTLSANITFAVTWTSSVIRDALGFTVSLSGTNTYTSTDASPYVWLPDQRRSGPFAPDGSIGVPMSDATVTMTPAGITKVIKYGTRHRDSLQYRYLSGRKVWSDFEVVGNESLQTFWDTVISNGYPVRHFPDRSAGSFVTWRIMKPQDFVVAADIEGFVGTTGQDGSATRWRYGPVDVAHFTQ